MPKVAAKKVTDGVAIEIPNMAIQNLALTLKGVSPLICHAWSEKAKKMMLGVQTGQPKVREMRDPQMDFYTSMYWMDGMPETPTPDDLLTARFGFPSIGFKAAAVAACRNVVGFPMTLARGAFHIPGEFIQINGLPEMREDMVRFNMSTDLRYRGEFKEWSVVLPIRYNSSVISKTQIANLFNIAGFSVGVGEWRPGKGGSYGMFTIA